MNNSSIYWDDRYRLHGNTFRAMGDVTKDEGTNRDMYERFGKALASLVRKIDLRFNDKRLLDYGCGNGFFSAWAIQKNAKVVPYDFSQVAVSYARQYGVRAVKEIPSGEFDIIFAFQIFKRLTDNEKWTTGIRNLWKRVSENGILIISDSFKAGISNENIRERPIEEFVEVLGDPVGMEEYSGGAFVAWKRYPEES